MKDYLFIIMKYKFQIYFLNKELNDSWKSPNIFLI